MAPYRYTSKRIANDGDPRMLLLQWSLSSLGFCSVSSDNFLVVRYTCLSVTHIFLVYTLVKTDTKIKAIMKYCEKNEFIKERWEVPLLNFERGPGVPLSNFEEGPGVPLLNFREVPGPTFKFWGGFRVLGSRVPRSRVPGSWSHFYTMPLFFSILYA